MISIDIRSRVPIYEQLIEGIKMQIINGVLEKDEQLPSVRQLAQELTINPNTIQKAYRELERDGLIYSVRGKGSFVNDVEDNIHKERIDILKEELDKIVQELLFLGLSKEEIISRINANGKEDSDDRS